MEWHREKVLNFWNVFNALYKCFVGNDSFKTPPEEETIACIAQLWFSLQILKDLWVSSMNSDL